MQTICLVLVALGFVQAHVELPADVQKCRMDDAECVMATTQHILETYATKGLRELNLVPFDPLHVKSIKLNKNPTSPVSVELNFTNVDIVGLKDARVMKIHIYNPKNISNCFQIELATPSLKLKGMYKVHGNVLILPVVGEGDAVITTEHTLLKLHSSCKLVQKSGRSFMQLDQMKLDMQPKHVIYKFDSLFDSNKELSDNMNVFINDNWQEIFNELAPGFSDVLAAITKHALNRVFRKYPIEEYFQ